MYTELPVAFTPVFHEPAHESSALVMSFSASICCTSRKILLCPSIFPQFIINTLLNCQTLPMCNRASHLSAESVEDVLLRDHLCPVPVHLLTEMGVFATLQLDESSHLCLKSLITQAAHLFSKAHQKLLNLCLHQLSARIQKMSPERRREKDFCTFNITLNITELKLTVYIIYYVPKPFLQHAANSTQ